MIVVSEANNFPFILKMSSNEKKMKQRKVFCIDEKMEILAEVDARVEIRVDPAAMLGLSVSMLNTIVSQRLKIDKSYLHCGPLFSKECKTLTT